MKILGREPALWLEALKAVVVCLALIIPSITVDVQQAIMVIATAGFGLMAAIATRPFQVAAIGTFINTVGMSIAAFGWDLPPNTLAAVVVLSGAITTLISRAQITPVRDPAEGTGGPLSP